MTQRPGSTDPANKATALESAWIRTFAAGRRVKTSPPLADSADAHRARLDSQAAWQRWHRPHVWVDFHAHERPFGLLFERARVERLAALGWPGMATNLAESENLAPEPVELRQLYLCAASLAAGDSAGAKQVLARWRTAPALRPIAVRWRRWSLSWTGRAAVGQLSLARRQALVECLQALVDLDCWQAEKLADAEAFAAALTPLVRRCGQILNVPADVLAAGDPSSADVPLDEADEDDPAARLELEGLAEPEAPIARAYPEYTVFSQSRDITAPAGRWYQAGDRARLERLNRIDRRRARQLAHRLQRRLEAARQRHWAFDQEQGLLDSRRLARLVQPGSDARVFRLESPGQMPTAAVSLLVDLSGSMTAERRLSAALAIDLAAHVLDICGVQCEVLGFTTADSGHNPVEQAWRAAGSPANPGRLNALRHVVFKDARQPWRRCRRFLGLLLREEFGHENIDGEALHWAAQRLLRLDAARRILIVLSDGAPFDRATAAVHGRDYLCRHLRQVIERLDRSPLQLLAMGTGTDVSRFYRHAVVLSRPEAVAETLFSQLAELLTAPPKPGEAA